MSPQILLWYSGPTGPCLQGCNENDEPAHVHISKAAGKAKYWLEPKCVEEYSYGFTVRERRDIKELVIKHRPELIKKWNEYFKK